jgi:hypothetical protein
MYYPKTQIETNLYSSGDLLIESTRLPYTGFYFSTYDGKYFSGKEPNDGPNFSLILPSKREINNQIFNDILFDPNPTIYDPRFEGDNSVYSNLSGANPNEIPYSPIPNYPILTPKDIANGQFVRYFIKKSNENIYTEVNRKNYLLASNQSLYKQISFSWVIVGDRNKVATTNRNQLIFQENKYKIQGLGAFLRFDYTQFYQG